MLVKHIQQKALLTLLFGLTPLVAWATPTSLGSMAQPHCQTFASQLSRYQEKFVEKMNEWSDKELQDLRGHDLLYLFSGPDVVTALSLFPAATHVTLVADQIPEYRLLVDIEKPDPERVRVECRMTNFFSRYGYYRTNDLRGVDGEKPRFLQLLLYSIAFAGATVEGVELLAVLPSGELESFAADTKKKPQGVRFKVKRKDGRAVTVDYLAVDLSNYGLRKNATNRNWLTKVKSGVLFLKSASHLLQSPSFSIAADLIIAAPPAFLVQDETGLSFGNVSDHYSLTRYGELTAPHTLWKDNPSAQAFVKDFENNPAKGPLPFRIGYEKESGSALIVGRRKQAQPRASQELSAP